MKLQGTITALVTPFTRNGGVNYEKLAELIEFQIENGAAGIALLSATGEASTILPEEARHIIRTGVETAAGRIPILVGCGASDTARTADACREAESLGADALLVMAPYCDGVNADGMAAHFLSVAEAVQTPVILCHSPFRTGRPVELETLARLREHPRIIGIHEKSGDIACITETASLLRDDFAMWSGSDVAAVASMALGACGVISVTANFLPFVMCELTDKCRKGDFPAGRALQFRYLPLLQALTLDADPISVKEAMNYLGFETGGFRLPLCAMSESRRNRLIMELERLEDISWKKRRM